MLKVKPTFKRTNKKKTEEKKMKKMSIGGSLKGGQKKLDMNKDGKISGEDFKMMRGYGKARQKGMGLQDESMQPGKVMMANKGMYMKDLVGDKKGKVLYKGKAKDYRILQPVPKPKKKSKGGLFSRQSYKQTGKA